MFTFESAQGLSLTPQGMSLQTPVVNIVLTQVGLEPFVCGAFSLELEVEISETLGSRKISRVLFALFPKT